MTLEETFQNTHATCCGKLFLVGHPQEDRATLDARVWRARGVCKGEGRVWGGPGRAGAPWASEQEQALSGQGLQGGLAELREGGELTGSTRREETP